MDYRALLEEAQTLLTEMLKVADKSVADYALQLQVTLRFIDKALDTEDRLDIFRALQKTYDVLEGEYDEDTYGDFVERLERALNGLHENYISKDSLKKLTKLVIQEISFPENKPKSLFDFIANMVDRNDLENPLLNDIEFSHKKANELITNMNRALRYVITSFTKNNSEDELNKGGMSFAINRDNLFTVCMTWASNIREKSPESRELVKSKLQDLNNHFKQIGEQVKVISDDIKTYHNHINAIKDVAHLKEILQNTKVTVNELFGIAKKVEVGIVKKK